jgi:AraC family transcriptional regulator of adaptative response/methylated-DNA-[protein]-cysteine methyltransferase
MGPVLAADGPTPPRPRGTGADADDRWRAVVERDERADDAFVFGVVTTGVYCRPSCPARRPLRRNVALFDDPAGARAAGLRPCRRCDPDGPGPAARRASLVGDACRLIDEAGRPLRLAELARHMDVSASHLQRTFVAVLGVTPKAYAAARRAERTSVALRAADSVTDAVWDAGYESPGRFHVDVAARLAMTPTAFRAGAAGERIEVAIAPSALGLVLVGATERGICTVQLGDDPERLVDLVRQRFPHAALVEAPGAMDAVVHAVVEAVEHPGDGDLALPLDVRGTAFQERVWRGLRAVASGTTTTYSDLAAAIGEPRAVRAVATACASNPIAVLVPCHRVVRRDGDLAGYRWGVERKAELLRREAAGAVEAPR